MRRTLLLLAVAAASVVLAQPAAAGPNADTRLVLHAVQTPIGGCDLPDPCRNGGAATVDIPISNESHAIYIMARDYDNLSGYQLRIETGWPLLFTLPGTCLEPGNCGSIVPPPPLDPYEVSCGLFNCVTGGSTAILAVSQVVPAVAGCFEIVESTFPFGTWVRSCAEELDPIPEAKRGRVCVDEGGIDMCGGPTPVEPSSWARVKDQYR